MTDRDTHSVTTEVKDIIIYYPSITQVIVESHCEIMWAENFGASLGHYPTANYGSGLYDPVQHTVISQHCLRPRC